jgi:alcohol dehydrogenase class IV
MSWVSGTPCSLAVTILASIGLAFSGTNVVTSAYLGSPMSFELLLPTRVVFGAGASAALGSVVASLGRDALIVTGGLPRRNPSLLDGLAASGLSTTTVAIGHEPTVADLRGAAGLARDAGCNIVVSIGGGSVLDVGKAVSALLTNDGDVTDYLEVIGRGRDLANTPVPHIAVPTTAGTGSEATKNAVVLSEEHGVKVSMRSPLMVPTVAVVDPTLTHSMPRSVTVSSGLDALTHLLESYVSLKANPLVDPYCEDGITRAARSLRSAADDGNDAQARRDMSLASLFGGIALANAGLGAVHGLVGVLGGRLHVPHGLACGCLLAPVFAANVATARSAGTPVLQRYESAARLLTGDSDATAHDGVVWLGELAGSLDLPRLGDYGLKPDLYADICADAARSSSMKGNPVQLDASDLEAILAQVV